MSKDKKKKNKQEKIPAVFTPTSSQDIIMGCEARDIVTDFSGIVDYRADFITGCTNFGITKADSESGEGKTKSVDWNRIEVLGVGVAIKMGFTTQEEWDELVDSYKPKEKVNEVTEEQTEKPPKGGPHPVLSQANRI